jgi:hypothetical protein
LPFYACFSRPDKFSNADFAPALRCHEAAAVERMTHKKMVTGPCPTGAASYKNRSNSRLRLAALGLVSLLLGATLLAQTLGLMHGLLHAPLLGGAPAAHAHHHEDADAADHGRAWLTTLFAGHDESSGSCRVYDQQGHSALPATFASLAVPGVLRAPVPAQGIDCLLGAAATPFEARAPPSSR